jgi:hypothetical protein
MAIKGKQTQSTLMPFTSENAMTGTQFKAGQSGNPKGLPKGTKHLSTHIKELLEQPTELLALDYDGKIKKIKTAPIKAIIMANIYKAAEGDLKAMDNLAKYGYGTKVDVDVSGGTDNRVIIETRHAGSLDSGREQHIIEGEVLGDSSVPQ